MLRDERGIPHVYADTPEDLFFAQGYVHAQDRFWEMDFRRHITAGRLSEMFGKSQIETDKFLRISGWRRVAEKELPLLSAETRRNLDSLREGRQRLPRRPLRRRRCRFEYAVLGLQNPSYTIEPWTPVDSVAWLKAMAWDLRGNMQEEIQRSVISATVGAVRTAQLFPPYPYLRHRPIVAAGRGRQRRLGPERHPSQPRRTPPPRIPTIPADACPGARRGRVGAVVARRRARARTARASARTPG